MIGIILSFWFGSSVWLVVVRLCIFNLVLLSLISITLIILIWIWCVLFLIFASRCFIVLSLWLTTYVRALVVFTSSSIIAISLICVGFRWVCYSICILSIVILVLFNVLLFFRLHLLTLEKIININWPWFASVHLDVFLSHACWWLMRFSFLGPVIWVPLVPCFVILLDKDSISVIFSVSENFIAVFQSGFYS